MEIKYHHDDLKTELIENGLVMIQEGGISNLSLRKLASRCSVSEAAPYAHFKNKEELLYVMQEYVTDRLYVALVNSYENSPNKGKPRSVLDMGEEYVMFFIENPTYFSFIFSQPSVVIDLTMKGNDSYRPYQYFVDKCFEIYKECGYDEEQIKFGIISMWSKVQGITSIATMKNVRRDFEWKKELERIIRED